MELYGIITKHEIVLALSVGLFVLEALISNGSGTVYKLTGKRIFKMALYIHHHFEKKKGWPESTVVIRFWIISIIPAMIGLATLKLEVMANSPNIFMTKSIDYMV